MSEQICGECKYHQYEEIDRGYVCVNADSPYCTEWTDYTDTCEEWSERGDRMGKCIKLKDTINKIVNTPTRVITDDLTALADRQHEIIDMLSDLPTIEVSEDCISRGKLISDLAWIWEDGYTPNLPRTMLDFQDMLEDINYKIRNAPSVMPKAKEGEWIETSEGTMCGNCHKFPYDDGEYHIANWHSDFCPNCGADMRGGKDD